MQDTFSYSGKPTGLAEQSLCRFDNQLHEHFSENCQAASKVVSSGIFRGGALGNGPSHAKEKVASFLMHKNLPQSDFLFLR